DPGSGILPLLRRDDQIAHLVIRRMDQLKIRSRVSVLQLSIDDPLLGDRAGCQGPHHEGAAETEREKKNGCEPTNRHVFSSLKGPRPEAGQTPGPRKGPRS